MRFKYIDSAKGLAMLLIVWGHTVAFSEPISSWALGFKITLFYIVTGFLLSLRSGDDHLVKKTPLKNFLASMGIPYAFYSALSFIMALVMFFVNNEPVDFLVEKLMRIFTLGGISTLWFLPSIFIGRGLFETVYCKKRNISQRMLSMAVILAFLVKLAFEYSKIEVTAALSLDSLADMLLIVAFKGLVAFWFITAGFELGKLRERLNPTVTVRGISAFALLALSVVLSAFNRGVDFNNGSLGSQPLLFFVTGICGSFGVIEFFSLIYSKVSCRFLEFVGENSLFIMTTHLPLYIVPIVFTVISMLVKGEGMTFDYLRAVVSFALVLLIEWVLILIKKKLTVKVKNDSVRRFLSYI